MSYLVQVCECCALLSASWFLGMAGMWMLVKAMAVKA